MLLNYSSVCYYSFFNGCPPNSFLSTAIILADILSSILEANLSYKEVVIAGTGMLFSTANSVVHLPVPESSINGAVFFKTSLSFVNESTSRSSSQHLTTDPWFHKEATSFRFSLNSDLSRHSNASPIPCSITYSKALCIIFTKCPAPCFPRYLYPFAGASDL